jgi:prepilin-type N-terminal cleavage/methylation domain-containing protein
MNRKSSFSSNDRGVRLSNGFTLMELLIVIAIILILMLMAIPTVGTMRKYANETSAKKSLQTIAQAEMQFESTFPANGYACSLTALGGDPSAGAPPASKLATSSPSETARRSRPTAPTGSLPIRSPPFRSPWARLATAATAATSSAPSSRTRQAAPTAPSPFNKGGQRIEEYKQRRFEAVGRRFEGVGQRFEGVGCRFEGVGRRFEGDGLQPVHSRE